MGTWFHRLQSYHSYISSDIACRICQSWLCFIICSTFCCIGVSSSVYILSNNLIFHPLGSAKELALCLEKLTNEKLLSLHSLMHLHHLTSVNSSAYCLLLLFGYCEEYSFYSLTNNMLETSTSFVVELGSNESEKSDALKRYHDFEKWMWKEWFNSLVLCAMKYGKKSCAQLLGTCDYCHDIFSFEDNHCYLLGRWMLLYCLMIWLSNAQLLSICLNVKRNRRQTRIVPGMVHP